MRDYRRVRDYNDYLMNRDLLLNFPFSKELLVHELAFRIMSEYVSYNESGTNKKVRKIIWINDDEENTFGTLGDYCKGVDLLISLLIESVENCGIAVNLEYESLNPQFGILFYNRSEFDVAKNANIKKLGICISYPDKMKLEKKEIYFKNKAGW